MLVVMTRDRVSQRSKTNTGYSCNNLAQPNGGEIFEPSVLVAFSGHVMLTYLIFGLKQRTFQIPRSRKTR